MVKVKSVNTAAGIVIRELRQEAELTLMELADKVGVTYQQIQKYEYGTSTLTLNRILQLAKIFDISPASFVGLITETAEVKKKLKKTGGR